MFLSEQKFAGFNPSQNKTVVCYRFSANVKIIFRIYTSEK